MRQKKEHQVQLKERVFQGMQVKTHCCDDHVISVAILIMHCARLVNRTVLNC